MSKVTELATGQLNNTAAIVIELIEANETPAVIIVRWPSKPSVLHPRRFPGAADVAARTFAAAVVSVGPTEAGPGDLIRPMGHLWILFVLVILWAVAIVVWVVPGAELVHSLSGNAVLYR
jgi:hypothetical protein